MKRHKVGLIRVLTLESEDLLKAHAMVIERLFPELTVVSRCIEDQPYGIYDDETERIAKPKILKLIKELEGEVEAIIVSCAADPGVKEARKISKVPIVGAGSAVASLSLSYGNRVGVLNLTERTPEVIRGILGEGFVAEDHPLGVRNTLDLLTDHGKREAIEAGRRLKERGAEVIALACTGYSTIGIAPLLEENLGLPVMDPVVASGAVALHAIRRRLLGREENET